MDLSKARGELASPAGTAAVLRAFGIRPRRRLGQHFLISRRALDRILAAADLAPTDGVLEIGAGIGTLTTALAERVHAVVAVEKDEALLPALRQAVAPFPGVAVVTGDVMALDLEPLLAALPPPRKVVSNLPYQIASPLVVRLLEQPLGLARLVITVQREVAARLTAAPGGKAYGALSVAVQYRARARIVARVPPTAFLPPPAVESAVVHLDVRERPAVPVTDEAMFFRTVRAAFAQRRKTVRNALAHALALPADRCEAACRRARIDPRRRGETLSLAEFAALSEAVGEESRAAIGPPVY